MSDPVDYYEVQAMIHDARVEIRSDIARAVREAIEQVRSEVNEDIRSLQRVLDQRTERLV